MTALSTSDSTYSIDFLDNPAKNGFYFDPIDGNFVQIDMMSDGFGEEEDIDICSGGLNEQGRRDVRMLILVLFILIVWLLALIYCFSSSIASASASQKIFIMKLAPPLDNKLIRKERTMPPSMIRPQIIVLKEGTDTSQGKGQLLSNITACSAVVDVIRTTLGPRGMDKLIVDGKGVATISNDGATILKLLDIVHPAARALVDVARAQDAEVGDGTTSVVLLAGELLRQAKPFIEENVAPQVIIKAYRLAAELAAGRIDALAVPIPREHAGEYRRLLERCARTSMYSKIISGHGDLMSKLVVDAVLSLNPRDPDERMIGMKRVPGGAIEDAMLVQGVAFRKTFSYAGFEQQPKQFTNPPVLCLNVELELKAERDNAEVRLEKVSDYQAVVDAEWQLINDRLEAIASTGAKVVLSKLPIGDLATQFFADRDIFCAGRVPAEDMNRILRATGAPLHSTVSNLAGSEDCGEAVSFEERQVGSERWNFLLTNPEDDAKHVNARTCTLILRGGSDQFIAEIERALHDAIMVVRRALVAEKFVAGGGAVEMELSRFLRDEAKTRPGRDQLILAAVARALEALPRQLCDNAGCDATDLLTQLRKAHAVNNQIWAGLDLDTGSVIDTLAAGIWEPAIVKGNMMAAACEAACTILSVDLSIKAAKPWDANAPSGLEQLEAKSRGGRR